MRPSSKLHFKISPAAWLGFRYNDRGELAGSSNNVDANRTFTWSFDLAANRLGATQNGVGTTYSPTTVDQYSSITGQNAESGISYDSDGDLAQDGTWYYGFDIEHRLWSMQRKDGSMTLTFQYDYLNRRVKKVVRYGGYSAAVAYSTKYVWSGQRLLAELDGGTSETGTSLAKSYVWGVDFSDARGAAGGAGGLLAVRQSGQTYFPTYDSLGNVTGYLNSGNGNVEASYQYNAFGEILGQGGNSSSFAFGFATQYTDRESGLVYYGARYYNPKHGRFISRDPIAEGGGLNLHAFVGNRAGSAWDVWGHKPDGEGWAPGETDFRTGCTLWNRYTDAGMETTLECTDGEPDGPSDRLLPLSPSSGGQPLDLGGGGVSVPESIRNPVAPDCAKLKALLSRGGDILANAIRASLRGSGVSDSNLNRLARDLAKLGLQGGDLGRSMISRVLFGGGLDVYQHDGQAVSSSSRSRIGLDFNYPMYDSDVRDISRELASGVLDYSSASAVNPTAWTPQMVVAHELGHLFLGIPDPINVVAVQNRIANSFRAAGVNELVRTEYWGPVWPRVVDGKFIVPAIDNGVDPNLGIATVSHVSAGQFYGIAADAKKSIDDFIAAWGCK